MLNIVIADENKEFVLNLVKYLTTQEDCVIKGTTSDGYEVMNILRNTKANVLVLGLILPGVDGYQIIKEIQNIPREDKPIIIVTSFFEQELYLKEAIELGADFYIIKPVSNNLILDRIRFLYTNKNENTDIFVKETSNFIFETFDVKKEITNVFHSIGIPASVKGHDYLREAVYMAYSDRDCLNCVTKNIYPVVAKRYNVNKSSVERAIRTAIEICWSRGRNAFTENIFGYTVDEKKGKPTNAEFITLIADKMKMEAR